VTLVDEWECLWSMVPFDNNSWMLLDQLEDGAKSALSSQLSVSSFDI